MQACPSPSEQPWDKPYSFPPISFPNIDLQAVVSLDFAAVTLEQVGGW